MKRIACFVVGLMALGASASCINHNELKMLRVLADLEKPETIILRQIESGGQEDEQLLRMIEALKKERDEARELLGELADFAEDNA